MRPWLARFSFSFLIVGMFLSYEAYKAATGRFGPVGQGRILLYVVAAAASFVLGFTGVRERHR
jgi:hypothetical protein